MFLKKFYFCFVVISLYCLIQLLSLFTSCFAELTEDESKKLELLHQKANAAMNAKDFAAASEHYSEYLNLAEEKNIDKNLYFQFAIKLIEAYQKLQKPHKAISLIKNVLQKTPPQEYKTQLLTLQSHIYYKQKNIKESYDALLQLLSQQPNIELNAKDKKFLSKLKTELNNYYNKLLNQAEHCIQATIYTEGIRLYKEILQGINKKYYLEGENDPNLKCKIIYRIAKAYYNLEEYANTMSILKKSSLTTKDLKEKKIYLLALAYEKLKQYDLAIKYSSNYLDIEKKATPELIKEMEWCVAKSYFMTNRLKDAKKALEKIKLDHDKNTDHFYKLAHIYLARIHILNKNYKKALNILSNIAKSKNDSLKYEIAYLQGEALFKTKQFLSAIQYFKQSIPKNNAQKAPWYESSIYNLGQSYLKLGNDPKQDERKKQYFFDQAEESFKQLISKNEDIRFLIALAEVYLLQYLLSNNENKYTELEKLLSKRQFNNSQESSFNSMLIKARAGKNYKTRKYLFQQITNNTFENVPSYGKGWFFRGLNHLQEGTKAKQTHKRIILNKAVIAFQKAFELLKNKDKKQAGLSLKHKAKSYFQQNSNEAKLKAFKTLEKLINQNKDIFQAMDDKEEILYLYGLVASHLISEKGDLRFLRQAKHALQSIYKNFPNSSLTEEALHLLGTIFFQQQNYEKAEEIFVKLANDHPKSKFAGEALFWAGESADWQNKDSNLTKTYRKKVFKKYPESEYAAEAYFNYYSFSEYLLGEKEAIAHLKKMENSYQKAPFVIVALYLLGLHEKQQNSSNKAQQYEKALKIFSKAKQTFDHCYENEKILSKHLEYFITMRYQIMLEIALTQLLTSKQHQNPEKQIYLEYAYKTLNEIISNFQDVNNTLAQFLKKKDPIPKIYEEATYVLIQTYIEDKNLINAEQKANEMIKNYKLSNISNGYYLSRMHYHLGLIDIMQKKYESALNHLINSENTAKGHILSINQKLDLWMQQSSCYRHLKKPDKAMLMLSRIINEDVASSIRIKAMFLRAEIYNEQGRYKLAKKQLEAIAKKGGGFASEAQKLLRENYGYN